MDARAIMNLAIRLARQKTIPEDSDIYVPAPHVRRALFAIDVDTGALLAAESLGFDLVVAHHPLGGRASLGLLKMLEKHGVLLRRHGVPREAADAAVRALQAEHAPRLHALNLDDVPSFARLLGMPLMNVHNPCDEIGRRILDATLRKETNRRSKVSDALAALGELPEFAKAETRIAVRMGRPGNPLGKFVVLHGAGTNGGAHAAGAAFRHGIDTVLYIHVDPAHLRRLQEEFGARGAKNLIVTGHTASDSLGINILVRALRERGIEVTCAGGIVEA